MAQVKTKQKCNSNNKKVTTPSAGKDAGPLTEDGISHSVGGDVTQHSHRETSSVATQS